MSGFDIGLVVLIGIFAITGFRLGAVHALGAVVGTVLGVYLGSRYYEPMAAFIGGLTGWEGNLPNVVMFIIAFIVINRLVGFAFYLLNKVFKIFTKLPFVSSIDKLLGLAFGILEGIITLSLIIYFLERFPISEKLMDAVAASEVAERLRGLAEVFIPLLPEGLTLLKSTVDFVEGVFFK